MYFLLLIYRETSYLIDNNLLRERYNTLCQYYARVKKDSPEVAETYKEILDEAFQNLEDNVKRAAYLVLCFI